MPVTTRRVALAVGAATFSEWTTVEIMRDLAELSGSFTVELRDAGRSAAAFPFATIAALASSIGVGMAVTVAIDGEPVLVGHIDEVNPVASERRVQVTITGRDKTGDLIDCAAAPTGPSEFKGQTLTQIAQRLAKPFGISVRAEVDVGKPFPRFVVDAGETVRSAIEKAARQRAVLVTSDGIGGLVLTRGGVSRAAGALAFPGNVIESESRFSGRERFSDYYVQGQTEKAARLDRTAAPLDATAAPRDVPVTPAADAEEKGVVVTGHARDDMVTRYRPTVSVARMQTTTAPAKTTAEWMARTARAKAMVVEHTVKDFRTIPPPQPSPASGGGSRAERGGRGQLWRPNQLVFVEDAFQGVFREMLIAAVTYRFSSERGATTRLKLIGPAAFDLLPEGDREQNHQKALDRTAKGL